jgi:hypothetical protein
LSKTLKLTKDQQVVMKAVGKTDSEGPRTVKVTYSKQKPKRKVFPWAEI